MVRYGSQCIISYENEYPGHHFCDLGSGDHGADGKPIANALRQRHYVRYNIVALKSPIVLSCPTESSLHLVRNADTSQFPDPLKGPFEVTLGILHCTSVTLFGLSCEIVVLAIILLFYIKLQERKYFTSIV